MHTGIHITRGNHAQNPPGEVKLSMLFNIIETEFAATENPFFGRASLEGLKNRLLCHILSFAGYKEEK